jgi:hypothetical protein
MVTNGAALATMLEEVLVGKRDLYALLDNPSDHSDELEACFHGLWHYAADEDIRAKDSAYSSMQQSEMRKLISLLHCGAPAETLKKVSFLGVSRE